MVCVQFSSLKSHSNFISQEYVIDYIGFNPTFKSHLSQLCHYESFYYDTKNTCNNDLKLKESNLYLISKFPRVRHRLLGAAVPILPMVVQIINYCSFQCDSSVVVLFDLCFGVIFVLFEPYVRFHSFSKVRVTEWPPIGK